MKRLLLLLALIPCLVFGQTNQGADLWAKAAYGSVPGISAVTIMGFNGAITTTAEPIWPESAAYTVLTSAMSAPYCASSDNTNDKAAGTGCLTMRVSGVNTSYATFSETVTLNGQTSVVLATANILFINTLQCLTAGSTFANTGTIRCGTGSNSSGVPAVVHAHMAIAIGKSQNGMYAVPANKTMLCRNIIYGTEDTAVTRPINAQLIRFVDPVAGKVIQVDILPLYTDVQSPDSTLLGIMTFVPKTIFRFEALDAAATGAVVVTAECLLIDSGLTNANQNYF